MEKRLHDILCTDITLRHLVCQYSEPSIELTNFVTWLLPPDRHSVEIGISSLSILMARRMKSHLSLLPTPDSVDRLAAILTDNGIEAKGLTMYAAHGARGSIDIEPESIDSIVLSCSPAFPAYFAWCHEALRMLRVGGRMIVRGTGAWTIEQFKNHLRIDPRFVGWSIIAPDAIIVTKHAETQSVEWSQQPYVVVNSTIYDEATLARSRSRIVSAGIESFSPVATQAARLKRDGRKRPEVGLIGYYGHGNYGDELFRTAFELGLPDIGTRMLLDMPRRSFILGDRRARADQQDAILIGGGDLISPGYWPDPYFDEAYLRRPVFVHGVGVPRWTGGDPKVIVRLRAFMQHPNVRHINVRDVESREWIETHLRPACPVEVSPDIVFSLDLDVKPPLATQSRSEPVFVLITRQTGAPNEQFEGLRLLVRAARARGMRARLVIAGAGVIGENDLADALSRDLGCDDIVNVSTMEEITAAIVDADLIASMKFHGCVIGLLAGKPTFALVQTDKFVNLYRALGIEQMALSIDHPDVPDLIDLPRLSLNEERLQQLRQGAKAAMADLNQKIARTIDPGLSG